MAENKIEQYLIDLLYTYQQVDDNLWYIEDEEHTLSGVAVILADSLVIFRVVVMDDPKKNSQEFYAKLLELNASEMVHGAYALEDGKVIIVNTLEYDTMDYQEFRAVLDAFSLALTQHYPILSKFRD